MASGTVEPAVGHRTNFAIKNENTWGELKTVSAPEDNWVFMPQTGNSIAGTIELLEDPTITAGRYQRKGLASSDSIEGSVDLTVDEESIGYPLYYTLGDMTEAQSGTTNAYQHAFYGNDLNDPNAVLPSFSIYRDLDKFDQRMLGTRVNSLSFDQGEGEVFTASMDMITRSEGECPSAEAPAISNVTTTPFVYREAGLEIDMGDGSGYQQLGNVVDLSFEINNNLETEYTLNSGKFIGVLVALGREITGSMTFKYDNSDLYQAYLQGNDMRITSEWDTGEEIGTSGLNGKMYVEMPLVKLDTVPIDVGGGDEIITQDIDFGAYYNPDATYTLPDGSTQTGYDIMFELTNEVATGVYNS